VNHGVNTLWGSFEIPNVRLVTTMLQQRSGFGMQSTKDMSVEKRQRLNAELEAHSKLMPRCMWFLAYYGGIDCDVVLKEIEEAIQLNAIEHVILDNLQFMTSCDASYSEIYSKQDQICHKLRMIATSMNVHVSIVIHPRKVDVSTRNGQPGDLQIESVGGSPKSTQVPSLAFVRLMSHER
jgi:twinkle protein